MWTWFSVATNTDSEGSEHEIFIDQLIRAKLTEWRFVS
jgi:hypothetical protein